MIIFTISLKKLDDFFNKKKQYKAKLIDVVIKLFNKKVNSIIILESEYHEFLPLFLRQKASKLLFYRPYNHHILFLPGKTPPFKPLYGINKNKNKNKKLKKYFKKNLDKGFIRVS